MKLLDWKDPAFSAQLLLSQSLRWMIDEYDVTNKITRVTGWIVTPFDSEESTRFIANGDTLVVPGKLHYDQGLQTHLIPDLPDASFRFSVSYPTPPVSIFHSIAFLPSGAVDSRDVSLGTWYLPDLNNDEDPLPDNSNIDRVIVNRDQNTFRLGGATVANRINNYLIQARGKNFGTIGTVLDWGCGCARVSRYVRMLGCRQLYGVDVDQINVEWCQANLKWFPVQLSDITPPIPFPDQKFDLIFGISVFTHLRESAQLSWLKEIARLLSDGGIAIVTVMREGQIALQTGDASTIRNLKMQGFLLTDDNTQMKIGNPDDNYYVNTYHTASYIYKIWQNYFDIVDIIPFMGAHQDAVILAKKPSCKLRRDDG